MGEVNAHVFVGWVKRGGGGGGEGSPQLELAPICRLLVKGESDEQPHPSTFHSHSPFLPNAFAKRHLTLPVAAAVALEAFLGSLAWRGQLPETSMRGGYVAEEYGITNEVDGEKRLDNALS